MREVSRYDVCQTYPLMLFSRPVRSNWTRHTCKDWQVLVQEDNAGRMRSPCGIINAERRYSHTHGAYIFASHRSIHPGTWAHCSKATKEPARIFTHIVRAPQTSRINSAPTSTIPEEGGGPDTTHAGIPGIVAAPATSRVRIPARQQHHHRRHLETPASPPPPRQRESPPPCHLARLTRGRLHAYVTEVAISHRWPSRTPQVRGKERRRLLHAASRPRLGGEGGARNSRARGFLCVSFLICGRGGGRATSQSSIAGRPAGS